MRDLSPEEWEAFELFKEEAKTARRRREQLERVEAQERRAAATKQLHQRGVMLPLSRKSTKMTTVNQWAKEMGITLSGSVATKVGLRSRKMYIAMFAKEPRKRTSWKGSRTAWRFEDLRRPWKTVRAPRLPSSHMSKVGVYPRLLIERAWQMVMTEELHIAEAPDKKVESN
jgi:hypothetical protein